MLILVLPGTAWFSRRTVKNASKTQLYHNRRAMAKSLTSHSSQPGPRSATFRKKTVGGLRSHDSNHREKSRKSAAAAALSWRETEHNQRFQDSSPPLNGAHFSSRTCLPACKSGALFRSNRHRCRGAGSRNRSGGLAAVARPQAVQGGGGGTWKGSAFLVRSARNEAQQEWVGMFNLTQRPSQDSCHNGVCVLNPTTCVLAPFLPPT